MADSFDPTPEVVEPSGSVSQSQKYALMVLGGLAIVAVGLLVVARRRAASTDFDQYNDDLTPANRIRDAWEIRWQGTDQRLDRIEQALGISTPPAPLARDIVPVTQVPPPPVAQDSNVPGPAAVSSEPS